MLVGVYVLVVISPSFKPEVVGQPEKSYPLFVTVGNVTLVALPVVAVHYA